jgi:hypothetical protein
MILLFLDLNETLFIPPRVEDHNELHSTPQSNCKEPIPKIRNKYSQRRNCSTTVPISTFICHWAIYIFPRSICLFCCRKYVDRSEEYINRSQTHEGGNWDCLRVRNSQKRNTEWDFRCSAFGHMSRHCQISDLSFFSAQRRESNPRHRQWIKSRRKQHVKGTAAWYGFFTIPSYQR